MTNELAHRDEFNVVHAGLHEIDLPSHPLKIADIICAIVKFGRFVVKTSIYAWSEFYTSVSTASILFKKKVHQFFPTFSSFEVRSRHCFEPAVVTEFDTSLLLRVSSSFYYFRWSSAELTFIFFVILLLQTLRSFCSACSAITAFAFPLTWIRMSACYAAAFFKLFGLPGAAESVTSSIHVVFMPLQTGEFNVS
jgi:hypothetical protein